jgi:hypothetical protein
MQHGCRLSDGTHPGRQQRTLGSRQGPRKVQSAGHQGKVAACAGPSQRAWQPNAKNAADELQQHGAGSAQRVNCGALQHSPAAHSVYRVAYSAHSSRGSGSSIDCNGVSTQRALKRQQQLGRIHVPCQCKSPPVAAVQAGELVA